MAREHLFTAFFFLVLTFLLYQVYLVFSGFLEAAIWAAILALVFHPVYRAALRVIGRPSLASAVVTLFIYLLVVLPAFGLGSVAVQQSQRLYERTDEAVRSGEFRIWVDGALSSRLGQLGRRVLPARLGERVDFMDVSLQALRSGSEVLVAQLGGIAKNLFSFVMNFFLMIVILFFFFRDGDRLYRSLRELLPMTAENKDVIFSRFYETLSAVVRGMTITAAVQGVLAGVAFWALGVPFALLLALVSAVASFIPIGGAALVWAPVVFYFLVYQEWVRAILMLAWGVLVISLSDNVVRPLVIGSRIRIPTLFLFFGILGGLQVYGVLGVFLGPVLLATIVAVFRIYREQYVLPAPVTPAGSGRVAPPP